MAEGLNEWRGFGNITEPEFRMTNSGTGVLKFRMACNERRKQSDGSWGEHTEWVSCVLFGKRAEALSRFLNKGDRVLVCGSLRTSSYEDREGNKRYRTEVVANNVILAGSSGGSNSRSTSRDDSAPNDDNGYGEADGYTAGDDSDQIPF